MPYGIFILTAVPDGISHGDTLLLRRGNINRKALMKHNKSIYQSTFVLFALALSLLFPTAALADDGTPPPDQAPETEVNTESEPSAGQTGTAVIEDNEISGYQKNGITVRGNGSAADIIGNQITGAGPTSVIAQNGIQISNGASATLINNLVTGNDYTGATWTSTGILLYSAADGVELDGNTVSGNQLNVYVYDSDNLQVTGNTLSDATDWGGLLLYSSNNAFVDGNLFSGNAETGLSIYDSGNTTITNNQFLNNGWGYNDPINYYYVGGLYINKSNPDTLLIKDNAFVGNQTGVWNDSTGDVDVTRNWWGDASGPLDNSPVPDGCLIQLDNPTGTGDAVSACLVYSSWLTSDPFAPPPADDPQDGTGGSDGTSPAIISVTGGDRTVIDCTGPSMSVQIGDVQVVFTGLCGYEAVVDLVLLEEILPGDLPAGATFVEAAAVALLKDGRPVETLPEGAGILVSFLEHQAGTSLVLAWAGSDWIEKDTTVSDGRVRSQVNMPGTFVLATK
jgi:parallel beta-helix repeat protein